MEAGEGSDVRKWDELTPDALGLIFMKLPLEDKLRVVPGVCKAWATIVNGPFCWQHIDILEWSDACRPDQLNRMLRLLLPRSSGSLRSLRVSCVYDDQMIEFISQHAETLEALTLTNSNLSDSTMKKVAEKFPALKSLDLSCSIIGASVLETFGRNCENLSVLIFNKNSTDCILRSMQGRDKNPSHSDNARAIAETMPKLKHLEMRSWMHLQTDSVRAILSGCPQLEFLDLGGCWFVKLDENTLKEKHPKLKVEGLLDCPFTWEDRFGPGSFLHQVDPTYEQDVLAEIFDDFDDFL